MLGLKMVRLLKKVAYNYTTMQVEGSFDDTPTWTEFLSSMQACLDHLVVFEDFLDRIVGRN